MSLWRTHFVVGGPGLWTSWTVRVFGALESHAKMQLLIEVLKTRHTYTFKEATLVSIMPCIKGRLHLFEPRDDAPEKGFNYLALVFGLWCSGPVVVELVTATTTTR